MKTKIVVLLLILYSCPTYARAGQYDDGGLRSPLPAASLGADSDASQPGLRGLEGNVNSNQPAPFEGANLPTNKSNKVKKHHHQSNKYNPGASPSGPDLSPVGHNHHKKNGFDLTDPAKTGAGLTDRAAKTGVGLTDRAAKTGVGASGKAVKEIFKAVF